jgi:hypothetical protein
VLSDRFLFVAKPDPTASQRSAAFWSVFGVVGMLVVLLTLSDLPWDDIGRTIGCPWFNFRCCSSTATDDDDDDDYSEHANVDTSSASMPSAPAYDANPVTMSKTSSKGTNYQVMNAVWNPEHIASETSTRIQYDGNGATNQHRTPDNALIQSFAAAVLQKQKQKQLDDRRVYAVNISDTHPTRNVSKTPADTMISWTQQLQEQLKAQANRESSASSQRQLISPDKTNDNDNNNNNNN